MRYAEDSPPSHIHTVYMEKYAHKSVKKNKLKRKKPMNKTQLIDMAADKSGLTKKDTTAALESIIDSIQETLAKGEQVALVGFGTFSVKARNARTAKVPGTDKTVDVPATTVAKFKVGKALKEAVAK